MGKDKKALVRRGKLLASAVGTIIMAPVVVYMWTFGTHITDDHQRWSEMGSAFSGIYTPILSVLTLVLLLMQVALQDRSNRHVEDQSFCQDARADSQYYLTQLADELAKQFDGNEIGSALIAAYAYTPPDVLRTLAYRQAAAALNGRMHRIMAIWNAYYALLEGLAAIEEQPYQKNLMDAMQKAVVMLSYAGCAALDNYVWVVSAGNLPKSAKFAQQLNQAGPFLAE